MRACVSGRLHERACMYYREKCNSPGEILSLLMFVSKRVITDKVMDNI